MKEIIIRMLDRLDDRKLDLVFFFIRGLTG
ncbi:Uncharacterised protein [uncultured Flavonifractor sp.]|nr:Uncharacterised protein [uncultured Flavonifractor sp.]